MQRTFVCAKHVFMLQRMKRIAYLLMICLALLPMMSRAQFVAQGMGIGAAQSVSSDTAKTQRQTAATQDSVAISLLTCTPGPLVYELYGHTAIRVKETGRRQSDWVFNYGTFSFEQPHFMWRFMLGQTDYQLGVVPYSIFYDAYVREGRGIDEQVLNLSNTEAKRLVDALSNNLLPQNATYRYNFFYDNCTTRAMAMIERAVDGKVVWPKGDKDKSLRSIVDEFSEVSPWNRFGQNLLLGSEADDEADVQKQMFAPVYAERFMENALVKLADGSTHHLAAPVRTLLPALPMSNDTFPISPMWMFGTLLAFTVIISLVEYTRRKFYWQYDVLLYLAQGLTGCIIAFLFFFSAHPAVGSNWLVAMFNPLPLVFFAWYMKAAVTKCRCWSMWVEAAMLVVALVAGIAGWQTYPIEIYLIIAALVVRLIAQYVNIPRVAKGGMK